MLCLNIWFYIFPSPLLYLPFPAGVWLEGLFESLSYIKGFANLPATFILLVFWLSLQWPPRTINNLILLCPLVLKLGSQSIKMPGCFSRKIGFIPFDVLHCVSSLGPERKLQHTAVSLGAAPQDQTGQNKRGRKKKSWICTEKATGRWGCKVPCLNVSALQFLKQENALVTLRHG